MCMILFCLYFKYLSHKILFGIIMFFPVFCFFTILSKCLNHVILKKKNPHKDLKNNSISNEHSIKRNHQSALRINYSIFLNWYCWRSEQTLGTYKTDSSVNSRRLSCHPELTVIIYIYAIYNMDTRVVFGHARCFSLSFIYITLCLCVYI